MGRIRPWAAAGRVPSPALAAAVAAATLAAVAAGPHLLYQGRVFPGVRAGGVDLGGQSMAGAAAALAVLGRAATTTTVTLVDPEGDLEVTFSARDLGARFDAAATAAGAAEVGRTGSVARRIADPWRAITSGVEVPLRWVIDDSDTPAWRRLIDAATVPPRNPRLERSGAAVKAVEGSLGRGVDTGATLAAVVAALSRGDPGDDLRVNIVFTPTAPRLGSLGSVAAAYDVITGSGLRVRWPGSDGVAISKAVLQSWVSLEETTTPEGDVVPAIVFDRRGIGAWLTELAPAVHREPASARFTFNLGTRRAEVLRPARLGLQLDVEKSIGRVIDGAYGPQRVADLAVAVRTPAVLDEDAARMFGAVDSARAFTRLAPEPEGRRGNIIRGAEAVQGVLLPPGQEFSFLKALGDVSAEAGYDVRFLRPEPAAPPGLAGGLEQVATTYYRAALWAGLPVLERHPAPLRVGWLEPPVGLDASVAPPDNDLKFVNATQSYLLFESAIDDARGALAVTVYAQPGYTPSVRVQGPTVTEVTAPPAPVVRRSDGVAPGVRLQVGWAREGAAVRWGRRVIQDGNPLFSETIDSRYPPARDVVLVGPRAR